jgi:cell division protein FtsB
MPKLTLPAFVFLLLLFFLSLGQSYSETKGRAQRIDLLNNEVETLRDKRSELEEELAYRQSPAFVEKEAREQLGYAKRGEVIAVLPDFEKKEGEGEVAAATSDEEFAAVREVPNWKQWRLLFFDN